MSYLSSDCVLEEKININGIPAIIFRPKSVGDKLPTIIHYHGWSSNKERQRMRAYVMSSLGYQLVIPDALNHGERNPLEDYGPQSAIENFWPTVFTSLEEFDGLIDGLIGDFHADSNRIGIMGHSMGGITGAGIFAHNPRVKTLMVLNGACAWENFNDFLKGNLDGKEDLRDFTEIEDRVKKLDPINNLDKLADRPMILQHGASDDVIDIKTQEFFYERARLEYKDKRKIKFMKYLKLGHLISTDMLEDSIAWARKYL